MADAFRAKFDSLEWVAALEFLDGPFKESLARRMLVEGGVLLRDAAKLAAPKSEGPYTESSRGSNAPGTLSEAIYLAYDTDASTQTFFQYNVTWNAKKAFWGKFVEFGHWRIYVTYKGSDGNWYTDKTRKLATPVWVPAKPFLRPTMDSYGSVAIKAMIARGQKELPILFQEFAR